MADLLHRLAERPRRASSSGTAWLRPRSDLWVLPPAATPGGVAQPELTEQHRFAAGFPGQEPEGRAGAQPRRSESDRLAADAEQPVSSAGRQRPDVAARPARTPGSPPRPARPEAAFPADPPRTGSVPAIRPPAPTDPAHAPRNPSRPGSDPGLPDRLRGALTRDPAGPWPRPSHGSASPAGSENPQPLLRPAQLVPTAARPAAGRPTGAAEQRTSRRQATPPRPVEIVIDRIDVRVPPAAGPPLEAKAVPAPRLSLADYLESRGVL